MPPTPLSRVQSDTLTDPVQMFHILMLSFPMKKVVIGKDMTSPGTLTFY